MNRWQLERWHLELMLGRYIIVNEQGLGWTGSRWAFLDGPAHICNFASPDEARRYVAEVEQRTRIQPEAR